MESNEWDKLEIVKTHPLKTIQQVQRTCTCKLGSKLAGIMNNQTTGLKVITLRDTRVRILMALII